ncbi:MAG TPA: VOC family protein [Candidatus Baltobacteraceae bacterium]|nr:VOC family protein [Candidatus Baltobacteraceae bacterium]
MQFDHIDLRVRNLAAARPFFDALLPAMGLSHINADSESAGYHAPGETGAEPFLWVVEDPQHRPGESRIAFAAPTRDEVDRLSEIARKANAGAFEAPALIEEYGPKYYASFFEDADGNKFEICCRR